MQRLWVLSMVVAACDGNSGKAASVVAGFKDAPIDIAAEVQRWAGASAPNMYVLGFSPSVLAGATSSGGTSVCPMKTESGNRTTWEGSCTDSQGRKWFGRMQQDLDAPDAGTGIISYSGFGYDGEISCDGGSSTGRLTYQGSVSVRGDTKRSFVVDLVADVKSPLCGPSEWQWAVAYSGSVEGDHWNGRGTYGVSTIGKVSAETNDELLDNTCSSEAESGTTTLKSGSHTAVITYDGKSKCDNPSTVKWSLDGVDKGELTGVQCSSASGLWGLAVIAWLLLFRRKSA